ncbi:cytochrome P450 [Nocardia sp. ET3-3]|uniref:Cytochrome P450 n=1 Tax=Nocardia terrae TaxID=2675851 RepID=A0A7K1UWA7_9NOCA|nr:cytochrome P450 [Nocardia terrae]MVU78551.1 cytochrome P450 [Nocardia terrae]
MTDTTVDRIEQIGDDFHSDPHAYYRRWRGNGPVQHVRGTRGATFWVIIGYAEARAALTDPRLRKGIAGIAEILRAHGQALFEDAGALNAHMLNSDPPDHTRLRKLVNRAFTPRHVAAMRPRIEEITATLLDDMAGHEQVDLLAAFANPLPTTVICELLGVPLADRDDFQGWTKVLIGVSGGPEDAPAAAAAMTGYLRGLIAAKRATPAEDLLSGLVHAVDEGDSLTENELVSMSFLLLLAGHETTVNLIGNGMYRLLQNPAQHRALLADPTAIPAAVEEFLRYDGPVGWATLRYTAEAVRIGETDIPAGELVYVALSAANRDPARYPNPDHLDLTADPTGHLGFGHGLHFCVGAPLARLEATTAFTALLSRFPHLRLADETFTPHWQTNVVLRGLDRLPIRLQP